MTIRKQSIIIALASSLVFSLLYCVPFFKSAENKIYDFFLHLKPNRERIDNVVFLDVDDLAIAHIGVFPWPRSVFGDGLIRLKEYGVDAAIFDIEFIDKSPTQVDELYLKQGLAADYDRSFSQMGTDMADILRSIRLGYIKPEDAGEYIDQIVGLIQDERDTLYRNTLKITSDNDLYLSQASALFGKTWGTLNLQHTFPLEGEQASRRAMAEERYSYPITLHEGADGGTNADILPALPIFMQSVKGAGFTNVAVDRDGIRRRIFPAREVQGKWYLQLAFAPLMDYFGRPDIDVYPGKLVIKDVPQSGGAGKKNITIPLDKEGAMLLDWPRETYQQSYKHVSFARFSFLDDYQRHIEQYLTNLYFCNANLFPYISESADTILSHFEESASAKNIALAECSDEAFEYSLKLRETGLAMLREFLPAAGAYIQESAARLGDAEGVREEADYCTGFLEILVNELSAVDEMHEYLKTALAGKICIIGRVDTGTTDIGVNPFHGEYVNVGTHAVLLDTVLSQSFMVFLSTWWSILLIFIFVPPVIIGISGCKPALRIMLGISGITVTGLISFVLFYTTGQFLGPLGPILAMSAAILTREAIAFTGTEKEKTFIRSAFSRYLSPAVIDQIVADPSLLNLGGRNLEMTAIFTDVRSFSTISESLKDPETGESDPRKLVELLNFYLTRMSDIILGNQGTIDKYEGDAIIAFFGAPIHMKNHASLACRSAIQMKKAEVEINKEALANGLINQNVITALIDKKILKNADEPPIFTRLGINTGKMVVGNMGTPNKMDYTIMGNAVNLAARLEGVNKQYGTGGILISQNTREQIGDEFIVRSLDRVRVVGINEPVRLYEVLDIADEAPAELVQEAALFQEALQLFENRDWPGAEAIFTKLLTRKPKDDTARLYAARCRAYQKTPPAAAWDGVFNLDQK